MSVAKYAEFDVAMSNVRAATMATAEEQRALGAAALESGADTAYSASEAAGAQEELAKAGLSVADIVGGSLNGALALAAAGQLEVARSAEIMATTLKVYRLPAEQAAHVSDLLAAAAGKAQGSVDDVSLALDYAGIGLAQFNVPLEESVGALALFAANGILGEKAGTGLRGALAALTGPSALGAKTMKEYGVEVFDAQGNFVGLAGVAGQLRTAFADLTEEERAAALNRIFGNESMNVANVLYKEGAAGVQEWTEKVDDSGFAAEQAAIKQDNLAGDVEKLGGAFDTAFIKTGAGANEVLRTMVQAATELVDIYGELPEPVQATALVLGVATAAALIFSAGAVGLRVKIIELKAQMDLANISFRAYRAPRWRRWSRPDRCGLLWSRCSRNGRQKPVSVRRATRTPSKRATCGSRKVRRKRKNFATAKNFCKAEQVRFPCFLFETRISPGRCGNSFWVVHAFDTAAEFAALRFTRTHFK
ncbi:phage tail tape measure protein, partial [Microbacterium sp. BR1]|uniref:phage tail tape measure protein n=1 Tax=Microbacterium sp. BR1 TaxID=1070896 RepID=UPI001E345AB6